MKHVAITLVMLALMGSALAQSSTTSMKETNFPLAAEKGLATICFDASDDVSVQTTARLFAEDVERVTGKKPALVSSKSKLGTYAVIIGTIEKNQLINELVKTGKLAIGSLQNQWERYTIKTIDNPFPGVKQALVIAGSDRRGTSYGVFSISETIGVSPWYWWADVPVQQRDVLTIKPIDFTSKSPSVKYRGIFINDEDWGLKPWSSNNYEKELGDIGPKTYAQVCELVLRLKGNMVAPAMHSCTGAFYSHPESKVAADRYGIIMTTSHCEPLLFNNAAKSEWDSKRDGEWNYAKNKAVILKKMDDRVREASPYENIYTIAMRGVHDEGLRGNLSSQEKVAVLTQVMADQRDVLTKYLKKPAPEIPQIFVPYKETMDVYELGLHVADDVTLVWVDDNYGYMKRLSGSEERKRSGGAGVYYHFSYLGAPHDYLWLNTTPPVLMYEELMKAYRTGADRYWLVNVGDIKPAELGMQTFFDLAWNVEQFDYASINRHQSQFLASTFGAVYEPLFQEILDEYYRLAWSRKPEFMGWEREWDAPRYKELANTDFSFQHYNDAQQRLADYQRISDKVDNVLKALPEASRPAFYELMAYPVMGAYQMNRKFLMAQLNNEQVKANNLSNANWAAAQAKAAYDSINSLTLHYNTLLDGKWDGMMALAPGWCAKYQNMPHVTISEGVGSTPVDLVPQADKNKREGCTVIDLKRMKNKVSQHGHTLRIIEGIGYDGYALQLGEATEQTVDPTNLNGTRVDYEFAGVTADSVTVHVYSVPFWALHKGKSTRYGLTVDGQPVVVSQSDHKEYSDAWKDRVMQNSVQTVATFPVEKARPTHTFTLTCGDPGMIIQRVVIDWGGLKKTYIGPSVGSSMLFSQPKKTPPLTPRWMLEQVVWEDSLNTQEAAVRLVDLYLKHQMPVGSIIIDSPWSMAYNDFTWNTARYPNATEMIRDFNKKHVKVILWLTGCINHQSKDVPVQKHPAFDEVIEKKYVVNDGKVSKWWKGEGLHLDFTNKEAVKWWNAQLDKVTIEGVYGFKVDQGEIYFGDTVHTSIGALSNVDFRPYYYNSLYQYATNKKSEGGIIGRPFSHQGGIEASVEQLSLGWCGDFEGSWSGLKLQINNIYKSAELGYGAPACEVGGFWNARSSKKELIRYAQFGAMTASMINGGENGAFTNHLPWYHGEEATFCYRQAAWLHSQLVPYLFSSLVDVHQTGGSIIKNTDDAQESHTVGDFLFTKAITSANDAVSFKLPQDGRWMDFWTKEVIAGGTTIQQVYPLNRFPLYIKTGAIIPMNITNSFSGLGNADLAGKQTICIVPNEGKSAYRYYRPLGDGTDYETINISYDGKQHELTVDGPQALSYAFILSNCARPVKVSNADAWDYNEKTQELRIFIKGDAFSIKINDGI